MNNLMLLHTIRGQLIKIIINCALSQPGFWRSTVFILRYLVMYSTKEKVTIRVEFPGSKLIIQEKSAASDSIFFPFPALDIIVPPSGKPIKFCDQG